MRAGGQEYYIMRAGGMLHHENSLRVPLPMIDKSQNIKHIG